jgi:hypothetical protein
LLFKKKNQHWKILCILKNFEPFLWNILKTLTRFFYKKMRRPLFSTAKNVSTAKNAFAFFYKKMRRKKKMSSTALRG